MTWVVETWQWIEQALRELLHWVEGFADGAYGPLALFLVAFAESSFFPIPPDALLIPLCLARPELALVFAAICSLASVLGGMVGYTIGYYGGRPLVQRLFRPERVQAVERYYDRYNAWATGIAGLTPLPFKLFTLSGGAFAIDFKIFVVASIVGRSLRFFAVAGLLYAFGEPMRELIDQYLGLLTIAFVVLLILGFWLVKSGARRMRRAGEDG